MARQSKPTGRGSGYVTYTAVAAEGEIEDRPLTFDAPLMERSPRPDAFVFWWRMLQYVFPDLHDPDSFPSLSVTPETVDMELFQRYIAAAEEMAESELLCADDEVTVHFGKEQEEHIEAIETSKEITRGFTTLLRQFDAKEEPASFQVVSGRLRKLSMKTTDGSADLRSAEIDAWRKAQARLHGTELRRLVRRKVDPELEFGSDHSPTYLLSAYRYGDLIHWDSKREVVATWEKDPFHKHRARMFFLEAAAGLAHLYIGFGELVRVAISERRV